MAAKKGVELTDIILIAGVAGGGYLLYKSLGKNDSTQVTVPQSQLNVNSLIEAFSSLLSNLPQSQQPSGSGDGSGGDLPQDSSPNLPQNTDPSISYDDLFQQTTDALNALGYNGFWKQVDTLNEMSHNENVAEAMNSSNPIVSTLESIGGGSTEVSLKNKGMSDYYNSYKLATVGSDWSSLLRPSTYTDAYDNLKNIGTGISTWWNTKVKKQPITPEKDPETTET